MQVLKQTLRPQVWVRAYIAMLLSTSGNKLFGTFKGEIQFGVDNRSIMALLYIAIYEYNYIDNLHVP